MMIKVLAVDNHPHISMWNNNSTEDWVDIWCHLLNASNTNKCRHPITINNDSQITSVIKSKDMKGTGFLYYLLRKNVHEYSTNINITTSK